VVEDGEGGHSIWRIVYGHVFILDYLVCLPAEKARARCGIFESSRVRGMAGKRFFFHL